jgi:SPP1 gp7 family putative phage head morphogenesis protein
MRVGRLDLVRLVERAQEIESFEEAVSLAVRAMPADAGSIIDFLEIPTGDAFDVEPAQAIAYFKAKGLQPTFSYADMIGKAHDQAFTVAKMMDVDMLGQVRASLDSAMANGTPFKEWADGIVPLLQSGGWWGRKAVVDPLTGRAVVSELGSPWRLETIFRTNMQSAYAAGAWQEIEEQADLAPFLMYDAIDDFRTRPLHASWDRTVLQVTSPWWSSHYPPNGYNCRCGVIQLSAEEVEALGLKPAVEPPDNGTYLWQNPRTGEVSQVPDGIDPGFDHNVGQTMAADSKKLLADKIGQLPVDMQAAAAKAMADETVSAASAAQAEVAAAAAKAALARAKALADEKAAQWGAKAKIDAIAGGKMADPGGFLLSGLKKAKKLEAWPDLQPTDQLATLEQAAAELKASHTLSTKLSQYKKAVLAGKTPPPSAVKAMQGMPEEEQAAFLAKLDAEKAAADAKKAAAEAEALKSATASAKVVTGTPPDPLTMTKIGEQKGSNPGGTYQDTETGIKWYVKQPASAEIARNEVLAGKFYELMGVEVPEMHLIELNGKPSIASRIVDGLKKADPADLAVAPGTAEGFGADAWLANWDVVGLGYDNLLTQGARAFRVDTGGALRYRAQGTLKGNAFGRVVTEIDSLRDPSLNRQAQSVFGKLTAEQIERSVERVLRVREDEIRALVDAYGPQDAAERRLLADLMIERQRNLAQRFPQAAKRVRGGQLDEAPAAARVTDAEQAQVEASRVNGYAFPTDSDAIEDNNVLVHTFKRQAGQDATRGYLKLQPAASKLLIDSIKAATGDAKTVRLADARQAILEAVKSINFRASKGQPFDAKVVERIKIAAGKAEGVVGELRLAAKTASNAAELEAQADTLAAWRDGLLRLFPDAVAGKPATMLPGQFPASSIPDELELKIPAAPGAPTGPKWKRVATQYQFDTAKFERSYAREDGGKASVSGVSLHYEAELADGTRVTYFPHDPNVAYAMQGVVQIDAPGRSAEATGRVFSSLDEIGVNSKRAGEVDRQHLYLNGFARIRLLRTSYEAEFAAISDRTEAGVQAKLALLKKATGVDVAASEGWKSVDGIRPAFGHGRAFQLRPDLDTTEFRAFAAKHVIFHNPQGLGTDAGSGVFERIKTVIEGGGMFAPLTDRVRRGVPLAGSSVSSDLKTGGGDYHFTRIRRKASATGSGIYWRPQVLQRMDAITYDSDQFGRTTPGHIEANRKGQAVSDFASVAASSGNETIFKGGMSIFDQVDRIVLSSPSEVTSAIAWMRANGYKAWPDGRALEEVILSKEAHAARL